MKQTTIRTGVVQGVDTATAGITLYKGIPYAAPPTGALRWCPPQPAASWDGVRLCDHWGNMAFQGAQNADPTSFYAKEFYDDPAYLAQPSEDCLYLNVWTPAQSADERLPVAVWFHGGAFLGGTGCEKEFDGEAFGKHGVLLVTVNYRCNVFGFFSCKELTAEQGSSGNYGILDQLAALRWVQENISAFGGDPSQVTIFGQSAGAMSVQTLVTSPLSKGLVTRAIMQSAGGYQAGISVDRPQDLAEEQGALLFEACGVQTLAELRALPAESIYGGGMKAMGLYAQKSGKGFGLIYTPVLDGQVLVDGYDAAIEKADTLDIDYMLGSTRNDLTCTPEQIASGEPSPLYKACLAWSAKQLENGRNPGYVYYFQRQLPGDDAGAYHSSELWYVFGTTDRCWRPLTPGDRALSDNMVAYWTNFIKTGDPNGTGLPQWEACNGSSETVMVFDAE